MQASMTRLRSIFAWQTQRGARAVVHGSVETLQVFRVHVTGLKDSCGNGLHAQADTQAQQPCLVRSQGATVHTARVFLAVALQVCVLVGTGGGVYQLPASSGSQLQAHSAHRRQPAARRPGSRLDWLWLARRMPPAAAGCCTHCALLIDR